ncbi:MAG: hypothetical protein IKC51_04040 [Myxococcaceae bacterium]|nr:hypothetical protein [Myxococcaceae bacterium]
MSIKERLEGLQILNQLDADVLVLKKAGQVFPARLAELDEALKAIKQRTEAERVRLDEIESKHVSLEASIAMEKDKVKKWEARLVEQRSTREYTALAREIDIVKKTIASQEELFTATKEELERARQQLAEAQTAQSSQSRKISSEKTKIRKQIEKHEEELAAMAQKRAELAQTIEPALLARYESACRHTGTGLAAVARAGTCRGCNMRIRPQLHNILRAEAIESCPSCHRLIYAEELIAPPPKPEPEPEVAPTKTAKAKTTKSKAKAAVAKVAEG